MSEIEQKNSEIKTKSLDAKSRSLIWLVLAWLFAIILLLRFLATIITSPFESIIWLIMGLILLPLGYQLIRKLIYNKFKFDFKRWMSLVCIFILLLAGDALSNLASEQKKKAQVEKDRIAFIQKKEADDKASQEARKLEEKKTVFDKEMAERKALEDKAKAEAEQKSKADQEALDKENKRKADEEEAKKPIEEQIANLYKKMGKPDMYIASKVVGGVATLEVDMDKKTAFDTKHYVEYNLRDFKIWGGYISELPVDKLAEASIDRIEVNYISSIIDGYGKETRGVVIGSSMDLVNFKLYSFENLNGSRFYPAVKKDLALFMYPKDRLKVDFDKITVNLK